MNLPDAHLCLSWGPLVVLSSILLTLPSTMSNSAFACPLSFVIHTVPFSWRISLWSLRWAPVSSTAVICTRSGPPLRSRNSLCIKPAWQNPGRLSCCIRTLQSVHEPLGLDLFQPGGRATRSADWWILDLHPHSRTGRQEERRLWSLRDNSFDPGIGYNAVTATCRRLRQKDHQPEFILTYKVKTDLKVFFFFFIENSF